MVLKSIIVAACTCLAVASFSANAALISYSIFGEVVDTDILDGDGNLVTGKVARIDFQYDDILSTQSFLGSPVDTPLFVRISVAHVDNSITTTNILFESWNDVFDAQMYSDSFNGGNSDMFFYFESVRGTDGSRPDIFGLGENFSAPDGVFNYDRGTVKINGFGFVKIEPVPVPAAAWLFGSGLLGLIGVARRKA